MFELYSRRNRDRSLDPDVYEYDDFPRAFRNQFLAIIEDIIDHTFCFKGRDMWARICSGFCREKGLKHLSDSYGYVNTENAFIRYVDNSSNADFLDCLDYSFYVIQISFETLRSVAASSDIQIMKRCLEEINKRFKQHNLGYELCEGRIIRIDNQNTHQTIVKPALNLLSDTEFKGANEEYLLAWDHYKNGNHKDAILNAGKAFESTLKIICQKLNYSCDPDKDTASKLLEILKGNGFYPSYLDSFMKGVNSNLKDGAPTVRNKVAGHGQGVVVIEVPDNYALYELNLVATNIVFLYNLYKEKVSEV